MKRQTLLAFCVIFSLFTIAAAAKEYRAKSIIIETDLDPRYVKCVLSNADNCYRHLCSLVSVVSSTVRIYYSQTQSETQQLLNERGYDVNVSDVYYAPREPAVYTHRLMDNGKINSVEPFFKGIAYHFIAQNFGNCPAWFREGLASFLSEPTRIVKGTLTSAGPSPFSEKQLRDKTETTLKPSVNRLLSLSDEQFYDWPLGPCFARALFYWLHETGRLPEYLQNAKWNGYELTVLEDTLSRPHNKINIELSKFIKKNCYAGAFLADGLQAQDNSAKEQAFLKALQLKPNYKAARLELARLCYRNGNYTASREHLMKILITPQCPEYRDAAKILANIYYKEKDYSTAAEYYKMAWEYSEYCEYKYKLAYKLANCSYYLHDPNRAAEYYAEYLELNWQSESTKSQVAYAQKSLAQIAKSQPKWAKLIAHKKAYQDNYSKESEQMAGNSNIVKLQTTRGDIVITLDPNAAPVTVENFLGYVKAGFYNDTIFHRVIPNFMLQGGGFTVDLKKKSTRAPITNEASNGLKNNRGTIAMARTNEPNSATSQFFINHKNNDFLNHVPGKNPGYAVFGKVTEGMDVADAIASVKTTRKGSYGDVPVEPVIIKSATIIRQADD